MSPECRILPASRQNGPRLRRTMTPAQPQERQAHAAESLIRLHRPRRRTQRSCGCRVSGARRPIRVRPGAPACAGRLRHDRSALAGVQGLHWRVRHQPAVAADRARPAATAARPGGSPARALVIHAAGGRTPPAAGRGHRGQPARDRPLQPARRRGVSALQRPPRPGRARARTGRCGHGAEPAGPLRGASRPASGRSTAGCAGWGPTCRRQSSC